MATQHNFRIKNGLEVGGVLIVNSNGSLAPLTDDIKLNDNVQLKFGTDNDANIRHDGNNTKFTHTGSGGLYIGANTFGIQNGAHNENYIMAAANGAVTVYYDGSLRLSTTSTGIKVEGSHGEATIGAMNTTGFHIYTDRDRFYFNKQISLIDNTLTSYDADLVLKRVGSTKLTLLSTGVSVGGDLTVSGNLNITGDINSTSVTDLDVTDKTITVGVGQNEANSGNSGLLVAGPSTQPSLLWNESANRWAFNYGVNVAGHVIASSNVYAAGPEGFVFGSSTSEGEYIKRSSNDLQFYSGGGHKFTIGTNTTLVSGNLLVPNNSSIQFGDANHNIQGGTNTGGGDMMITSSDDLWLRSRWIRFQDIAGSAGEYARIAWNGSWIYSTLTSQHIKPQSDSSYNLGEVNTRYATVFGDTGRFADLDIDNNVDIDGTLETDGLTVNNNPVYIRQQKGASNAGAGYYRVAENTVGGAGRGAFICTLYTTGGNYAPREVVIQGHTDWSSTETIHTVKSSASNTYFTKARIVRESGDAFLEVYISQAITDLEIEVVAVGHAGWVPKNGTLTAATGTETRVGPEVLIAPGLNTQDVVNATQGFQVNNQTIVDNSRNIENITSITTEGTAASGAIVDMRPSDTNQMFRVRFPDSSTMEMGTTRAGSGNVQKAVVYGQAGVDISTNGVIRASMTQAGDFSLDPDCGGLYFGGSTRSSATNAQEYIKKNGLNLDIKGNDNVRLLGDGGNIILWADYTGKVGIGTGTSAPTAKLDVKGDGADIFLQSNDFKIARIQPRGTGANLDRGLFSLFNQSTEAVRIDSDGPSWFNGANVGIGTDAAEAPLEIYKAVDGDSVGILVMNQKSYGSGSGTNERSTIALGIAEAGQNSLDRLFGTIHVRPYNESDSSQGILSFGVRGTGAIRDDVLVLRGYGATDQRVGIGTNDPAAGMKLHVNGAVRVDNNEGVATRKIRSGYFSSGQDLTLASGSSANIIMDTQKVGVGVTGPLQKLDVRGGNIMVGGYGGGADYGMIFTPADGSSYWHIYNDTGGELVFGRNITVGSTEFARFDSTGKLGIGEENPVHLVEANGTDASFIAHYDSQSRGGIAALTSQRVAFLSTSVNDDLVFGKASNPVASSGFSEYMRLNNGNARLGIGSAFDADATLHVDGGAIIGGTSNKATDPIAGLHVIDDTYSQWHQIIGPRAAALRVEAYYRGNNAHDRAVGDYAGGIVFNILGGHSTTHDDNMHCWIGPRVWDTPGRERAALVFATNNDTGTQPSESTATILERMCITPAGNVGIGTESPSRKFSVESNTTITTGFNDISEFLDTTIGAGGSVSLNIGRANSTKNLGKMAFKYAGSGSNSNALNFGFYDADNLMTLTAEGAVSIHPSGITTGLRLHGRSSDNNFYIQFKSNNGATTYSAIGTDSANTALNIQSDTVRIQNSASNDTYATFNSSEITAHEQLKATNTKGWHVGPSGRGYYERYFISSYAPNNTANQMFKLNLGNAGALNGVLEITVQGTYSYQDVSGYVKRTTNIGINANGGIWRNDLISIEQSGKAADAIVIGPVQWDSSASNYYVNIYKITSHGNAFTVGVKLWTASNTDGGFANFTLSNHATLAAPSGYQSRYDTNAKPQNTNDVDCRVDQLIEMRSNTTPAGTSALGTLNIGNYSRSSEELRFGTTNNGTARISFKDNNWSEGTYIKAIGQTYGGKIHFGAMWDDEENKITMDLQQGSAGASYDARLGIGTENPSNDLHIHKAADASMRISSSNGNSMSFHQDSAWNSNMYFGSYYNGSNVVYGTSSRGAFRMVALHDGDSSPQYLAFYGANAGTAGNTVSWNTAGFAMDEDGNVGIKTTTPSTTLEVNGPAYFNQSGTASVPYSSSHTHVIRSQGNNGNGGGILMQNDRGNHSWGVVAEMRINASSDSDNPTLLFSSAAETTNTWGIGYGYTDTNFRINRDHGHRNSGWGVAMMTLDRSGNATFAGNVTAYSDVRLKENIKTIPDAVETVKKIRGVTFDWKESGEEGMGVIAQEIEEVPILQRLVSETPIDGASEFAQKNVAYGNMVGLLIEAIKEQQEQIEELKTIINNIVENN